MVAKGVKFTVTLANSSNLFCAFLPLNIFILYLVDFFVDFGIDLCNDELKYSSETSAKARFSRHCFGFQSRRFSLLVGYDIQPGSSSTNQNAALIIDH